MKLRLFLLGFLTLFLELTLIRYMAGIIWNLSYFPNIVLLGAFIGLGGGFLLHNKVDEKKSDYLFVLAGLCLVLFILVIIVIQPKVPWLLRTDATFSENNVVYFSNHLITDPKYINLEWFKFIFFFFGVMMLFALIAQNTAKVFRQFEPLVAYSLDIGGSLAGVSAFIIISYLQIPPAPWFVILAILWFSIAYSSNNASSIYKMATWVTLTPIFLLASGIAYYENKYSNFTTFWSPYQQILFIHNTRNLVVNGIGHQIIKTYYDENEIYNKIYPLRAATELPPYKSAMIIGAGTGNDVAYALHHGVEAIDAIEIDPVILEIGKKYNPLLPYSNERVNTVVDDGRHALFLADKTYDLIIFALTDSLIKSSPVSELRLENYLFTQESFERAWSLLNEGGSLVMYNFYRHDWVVEKIKALLAKVSKRKVDVYHISSPTGEEISRFSYFVVSKTGLPLPSDHASLAAPLNIDLPTDDWPFLYIKNHSVPSYYLVAIASLFALILATLIFLHRAEMKKGTQVTRYRIAFVLMGAAFLLLETKSVIQFSLLFGTTWITNSMVFFGALSLILLANIIAWRIRSNYLMLSAFVLVIVSCLIAIAFPISTLISIEHSLLRATLACILVFTPVFAANLVFASIFRERDEAEKYFGWNLIGGSIGGLTEYLSLATGYNFLAWMVLACYLVVIVLIFPDAIAHWRMSANNAKS